LLLLFTRTTFQAPGCLLDRSNVQLTLYRDLKSTPVP
jgi:hypothetical protein